MSATLQQSLDEFAPVDGCRWEGWEYLEEGKPMIVNAKGKRRLEYCPKCGPRVLNARIKDIPHRSNYADDTGQWVEDIDRHLERHSPADFGLSPLWEDSV